MWGSNLFNQIRSIRVGDSPGYPIPGAHHYQPKIRQTKGFTLIELMVAITIIGILAAIAVPYFGDYLQRGKLSHGISTLSQLSVQMEKAYLDFRNYANNGNCIVPNRSDEYFNYSCSSNSGQDFQWRANSLDGKYTYQLDEKNEKKTLVFNGSSRSKDCWLIAEGSCY